MIRIEKINNYNKDIIKQIVEIHMRTFSGFFLTFMGRGFLKQMYSSYCTHKASNIIVAYEENKLVGFLAYSGDLSGLYKYMIKRRLLPFAWYSIGAFLRKPSVFMRLLRAFLKPNETKRDEKYMELSSIGVDPNVKSRGIGSQLIDAMKANVNFNEYAYITLETDAINNEGAIHFYQKNGFVKEREFVTNEGRKMIEYRYRRKA